MRSFDMYCGLGGGSHGAALAGCTIVGGIDAWPLATAAFSDNFPGAKVFTGRVEDLKPSHLRESVGPVDLLLASPECTNHSVARGARPRCDDSRNSAFQVARYARVFGPRWIVIENVIQMRQWSRYPEFLRELRAEGYAISELVLNAIDYGVPQKRRRLFILCDRERRPPLNLRRRPGRKKQVARVLDRPGSWKRTPLRNGRRATATLERASRAYSSLGDNAPFLIVYYGSDGAGGWQRLDEPLRTITTVDRFGLCEPSPQGPTLRMLQVPELARAMGFNGELVLERGSRREQIMLLGNGVCPPVMESVVRALID